VNQAYFANNDYGPAASEYTDQLPGAWRTKDLTRAVLVVCVTNVSNGASVRTCPYRPEWSGGSPAEVTFHKVAVTLKAYELRTGRLVVDTSFEIGGASCPRRLEYSATYDSVQGKVNDELPSHVRVTPSPSDVRAAFTPVIVR
jgi:hypothetical protein